MEDKYIFTAHIEKDSETGLYIGYIPSLIGAHTQSETLDELYKNLEEVAALCLEELENDLEKI
jgi:predicted RNase H-like HicB family nuclease